MALALTEPMNHPKRTQEIATILCELLGGNIELPRKIVSILKDTETEWSRNWHIHRLSTRKWYRATCGRECPWVWELREYVPQGEEAELWDALVDQLKDFCATPALNLIIGGRQRDKNKDLSIADRIDITNRLWES